MALNITKLANMEENKSREFLDKMDSKLMMDVKKSQIIENNEWIEMMEFTIPYIEKALIKQIKQIVTEEEVIKIELIKKVTVESVKHLSKNVNFVDRYDQKTGDVIPKKILNAYKEETFLTYENRFLFTLIKFMEDFIFLRERDAQSDFKGKDYQKATYQAATKFKKEKIKISFNFENEKSVETHKSDSVQNKIKELKKKIKMLKSTELYQILEAKRATQVKSPLKMTNVLLKNVNFQYAVKLWNYLNEKIEIKSKAEKVQNVYEEKGMTKELIDEDIFLMYMILKTDEINVKKSKKAKNAIEDQKERKELTDALMEKIISLNPELTDKELKEMLAEKYLKIKTKRTISLKPIEDRFREKIEQYMLQVKEVRLK